MFYGCLSDSCITREIHRFMVCAWSFCVIKILMPCRAAPPCCCSYRLDITQPTLANIMGSLCDQEVACSTSNRQGSNFESCVWKAMSSHSSNHPQEVLMTRFSLYEDKGGINPIYFISFFLTAKHDNRHFNPFY